GSRGAPTCVSVGEVDDVEVEREPAALRFRGIQATLDPVAGQIVAAGDVPRLPGQQEVAEDVREAVRSEHFGSGRDVQVQVRGGRIAGVAEIGDHLPPPHAVARLDPDRAELEVGVVDEVAAADVEHDVVAVDGAGGDRGRIGQFARHL